MAENDDTLLQGDRRLQSLVYDIDKRLHAVEVADAKNHLEIAFLKGEISGIRSSTASSFEVQAASKLITQNIEAVSAAMQAENKLTNTRIDHLSQQIGQVRAILIWSAVTFVGIVAAAFQFKIVVLP